MERPLVSVVMGVRNAENGIGDTLESILSQEDVKLEFIVVDDGSTDRTRLIVEQAMQKDSRIKLLSRSHKGLTLALIEGCTLAKGEFIARQDAPDISLPKRLIEQTRALIDEPNAVMCSTGVRMVTKEGEEVILGKEPSVQKVGFRGIIHGSVMMRRDAYMKTGGYRREFYYAQDIDLWSRLIEIGNHISLPSTLYQSTLFVGSISGSKKKEQDRFAYYVEMATKERQQGGDEIGWLEMAESFSNRCKIARYSGFSKANGAYFIGACLVGTNPELAKSYFREAVAHNPLHLKARFKLSILR